MTRRKPKEMATRKAATKPEAPVSEPVDPLLNYREAGELLGRSRQTIQRWVVKDRILKAVRLPTGVCAVRRSEIDKILTLDAFQDE